MEHSQVNIYSKLTRSKSKIKRGIQLHQPMQELSDTHPTIMAFFKQTLVIHI